MTKFEIKEMWLQHDNGEIIGTQGDLFLCKFIGSEEYYEIRQLILAPDKMDDSFKILFKFNK